MADTTGRRYELGATTLRVDLRELHTPAAVEREAILSSLYAERRRLAAPSGWVAIRRRRRLSRRAQSVHRPVGDSGNPHGGVGGRLAAARRTRSVYALHPGEDRTSVAVSVVVATSAAYSAAPLTRTHRPRKARPYAEYRPCLRREFSFTCADCLAAEREVAPTDAYGEASRASTSSRKGGGSSNGFAATMGTSSGPATRAIVRRATPGRAGLRSQRGGAS